MRFVTIPILDSVLTENTRLNINTKYLTISMAQPILIGLHWHRQQ